MGRKKQTAAQAASEASQIVEGSEPVPVESQTDLNPASTRHRKGSRVSWTQGMEDTLAQTLVKEIHMGKRAQSGFKSVEWGLR
jgi:hypothetical protein